MKGIRKISETEKSIYESTVQLSKTFELKTGLFSSISINFNMCHGLFPVIPL